MYELKPCPFCGGEAEFRIVQGEAYKALTVVCKKCGANGAKYENRLIGYMRPISTENMTKLDHVILIWGEEAAASWNKRVVPEPPKEEGGYDNAEE